MKKTLTFPVDVFLMKLTSLELRIIAVLRAHEDKRRFAFPGQATIAELLGTDRARVTHTISDLLAAGHIAKTRHGRRNGYQIGERFYPPIEAGPARTPTRQSSLLLPIAGGVESTLNSGDAPATGQGAAGRRIGVKSTPVRDPRIGVKSATTGDKSTPGRRIQEGFESSSTIESSAARARERVRSGLRKLDDLGPVARFARPGAERSETDRAKAREGWLRNLADYVRDCRPSELERFWAVQLNAGPADAAELKSYLNGIDAEMRKSAWYRERGRRRAGRPCGARAPMRRAGKKRRVA